LDTFGASGEMVVMVPVADVKYDVIAARRFVDDEQMERQTERLSEPQRTVHGIHLSKTGHQSDDASERNSWYINVNEEYSV